MEYFVLRMIILEILCAKGQMFYSAKFSRLDISENMRPKITYQKIMYQRITY